MKQPIGIVSAVALTLALGVVTAQTPPPIERQVLQRADLAAPGLEVVQAKAIFTGPGATTGAHTHPGEEITYVLEGTVKLEMEGQPAKEYKAGEFFIVPAGKVHTGIGVTKSAALATYVVEKGKPLTTPAK